ncbi:MAG: ribonuclease J [Firmicutes bacterium]|nr:ribonuclease J [Bacillota bacterium]
MAKNLKVIFLGGVGEIGKNMTALEFGDDIVVVDAGLGFPTEDMPGIDLVVQDISYLIKNKDKVKGYVITHAHEDHIGGLPYALAEVPAQIYGSRLSLALIDNKLREHPGVKVKATSVKPRSVVNIGPFAVEFIHVNHSVAGSFALSITTPVGVVFISGDFKIDLTPPDGQIIDLTRIGEIGKKGVSLFLCESTNAGRKGFTMSETTVSEKMDEIFEKSKDKRIFVATFSSNVHRVQQLLDLAEKHKRKVAFSGRSMINVTDTAIKIGEMRVTQGQIIDVAHVSTYADKEVLVILTGSQGEPSSALVRMSTGDFNKIHLGPNDLVILSSHPIPGNERSVNNVVNNLIKRGVEVVYESLAEVHVSGHACEEELKIMHALLKPLFFIPVHGEQKHMRKHAEIARRMGMPERNIAIPDIGDIWELSTNNLRRAGSVPSGIRLIDGKGCGTTDSNVLRDRMTLAEEGICIVGIGYCKKTGEISSGPDVMTRGLLFPEEMEGVIPELKQVILESISKISLTGDDANNIRNQIRRDVQQFFHKQKNRRPIVVTMLQAN